MCFCTEYREILLDLDGDLNRGFVEHYIFLDFWILCITFVRFHKTISNVFAILKYLQYCPAILPNLPYLKNIPYSAYI